MPTPSTGNRRTEHRFSQVPKATIPRSQFDRSHTHKTTFDSGLLIPIYVDEVLPGDTFNLNLTMFARLATPIFPIMDNMVLDVFFFFVPNRLVWDNWQKFCGEQDNPADSIAFTLPVIATGTVGKGSIFDYMGIPPSHVDLFFNTLPCRAYNLIWNEWFRDENLQNSVSVPKGDGPDSFANYGIWSRGKRHDYFTSCLPWPQKQTLGVSIPLGDTAPVERITSTSKIGWEVTGVGPAQFQGQPEIPGGPGDTQNVDARFPGGTPLTGGAINWGTNVGLQTDLSTATATTINALRESFQIQKLLERDARGGTRYTELVRSHFGVTSPDSRLQRSEFLSSGTAPLIINAVAQTDTNVGVLAAFGTAQQSGIGFNKSFTEHGIIIGLVSARADLTYQQGLHRMWSRSTRYDFFWPAFANLGEQGVLNKEIFAQGNLVLDAGDIVDDKIFGYQERWAEYRFAPSRISDKFRSEATVPLDAWHLAQEFLGLPILGNTFIKDAPPVDRVIAVPTEPHFIFDSYFTIKCARPMPVYSVPGLIDHF